MSVASRPVLVCADLGDDRCGVGSSEAATFPDFGSDDIIDPCGPVPAAIRAVRTARNHGRGAVVAFPTRSSVRSARAIAVITVVALLLRRNGVRFHLHEYRVFDEIRAVLDRIMVRTASDIVVSTQTEAEVLRSALAGRVAAHAQIHVVPPANGTAPTPEHPVLEPQASQPATIGIFGTARANKDLEWAVAQLRELEGFGRLELAGAGWEVVSWPEDIGRRYEILPLGSVDASQLAATFARWGLALAPLDGGAHDGRMSLRTPLAHGVPTIAAAGVTGDLTFRPAHLHLDHWREPDAATTRADDARCVSDFESDVRRRLRSALGVSPLVVHDPSGLE